jgi:hypothetical protein
MEAIATSMTAGSWGGEIGCIRMDIEYHVRGTVSDEGILMGPYVVEELLNSFHGVLGRC